MKPVQIAQVSNCVNFPTFRNFFFNDGLNLFIESGGKVNKVFQSAIITAPVICIP